MSSKKKSKINDIINGNAELKSFKDIKNKIDKELEGSKKKFIKDIVETGEIDNMIEEITNRKKESKLKKFFKMLFS